MKKTIYLITFLMGLISFKSYAQIQFWSDNFEDVGAPSSGARTPSTSFSCGGPPSTNYFNRTDLAGIALQSGSYTGFQGSKFWAGEDIDFGPTCTSASISANQQVTWSSINISGKSGLSFTGAFAANSSFATNWEGSSFGANQDFMLVEYRIDGGAWTKVVAFYASTTGQTSTLKLETTGDLIGDGADLTYAFADFSANIIGTGSVLDIRLNVFANGTGSEELAVDNFRLFETPACTAPTITANPPNRSICAGGNTTFTCSATGATAYQWQVDTGSGFGDITNGGVYSNATTNTLTITGATAGMNGYLYRCKVINGVASCFTNTTSGTLSISNISTASASQTNVACNGGSNGAASVSPSGGIGSYTYSWSPAGGTGSIATGLSAGSYTVTVTDAIGCTGTRNYTITQPPALVLNALSQTNVSCNGGANGAAAVNTASGGTPGYTYNWTPGNPTGDGTTSVTGLTAGTWTCTVTDANACTATRNFTITQPTALVLTPASQTNVSCNGGSNGAASVNAATGGAGGYTYNWTPGNPTGDGTVSVTGLTAGTWTCTVTDANSCTASTNFTVTQPTAISLTPASQTNVSCNGGSNGAASVNAATGGAGGYTYNWTPGNPTGDGTVSVTGLTAGTWTCTVTDANSCTASTNFTVTQPTAISLTAASQTNVSCNGGSNGAASVNAATGGAGGYTYNWTPGNPTGDGTVSVTGLTAGTWTCTVTDANGCTASTNFTVTQPTAISLTAASQTNIACNGGSNGAASVNAATGGAGGYTYNWTPGNPTGDGTVSVTGLTAGTWTCTVTDANACTASTNFTITQPAAISLTAASQTNVSCNGGSNGAASVNAATGGAGGYTYNWTPGNPTGDGTTSVTGLTAGTWTCTVTDANACTTTRNFTITQPTALVLTPASQTNISCNGGSNGAASVNAATGGAGGYTYNWTPGNPTGDGTTSVTGLTAGTWTCTVTDANACTASTNFTITQPTAISLTAASQTNVSCNGGSNGAASVNAATGGAGGYTYNWTPGNPTGDGTVSVTGLTAGTWTCTVTDANACTASTNFTITQPASAVSGTTVVTNVACFGGNTGAINLTPTGGAGPYTFVWGGGATTEDRTGLTAGTYSVTITDANGCTGTVNATVTQPASAVSGTTVVTNVSCFGGSNGAINLTPTGGVGPYTFVWVGGATTEDRTGLTAGTYSVTITDANGCTGTVSPINVTQPASAVSGTTVVTNVSCFGGSNGAINLTPTGGVGPYTFVWVGGATTEDRTGLTAGTYSVTITDANGCTGTVSPITITQPASAISGTTVVTNVACFGGNTGAINLTPTGGVGSYTFDWGSGITTEDRTGLTAGTYSVTITDANGCTGTISGISVTQPASAVSGTTVVTNVACFGGNTGAINLTPTGGVGSYTFDWGSGITTEDRTGLTAGTYSVIITDANGCTGTVNATVTQPSAPVSGTTIVTDVSCFGGSNGTIDLTPTGGVGSYTFDWGSGVTTEDRTGLSAGTYSVIITDANGCSGTVSVTVTQPASALSGTTVVTDVTCFGGSNGSIALTATGGTPNYSYSWSPSGGTGATASGLTAGSYTVTITDANGCQATVSATVTEPAQVASSFSASACASYTWNSQTYTTSGTYTQTLTTVLGCDSIVTLTLTITPTVTSSFSATGCDSYTWNSQTYTSSGTYTQTFPAASGCDSVVTLMLTINVSPSSTFSATACDSYTWNAQTYTASGTYTQTFATAGCDSTVTLNLTINQSTPSSMTVTECDSYTLNGQTYTSSGTYTQLLSTTAGCDSVLTLNLTILQSSSSTTTATACGAYTWNGQTYTTSGTYTQVLQNAAGCDSVITLSLTILSQPTTFLTQPDPYSLHVESNQTVTYQWIDCGTNQPIPGETSSTFTTDISGAYAVIVSNGACSTTSSCAEINLLGIAEYKDLNVSLVPNPASDLVKLTFEGTEAAAVVVYDAQGNMVITTQVLSGDNISVDKLVPGVYLVNVVTGNGTHTERLMKQ